MPKRLPFRVLTLSLFALMIWHLGAAGPAGQASAPHQQPGQYCNTTPITIPPLGRAVPYPAPLVVSSEGNALAALTVTFNGVSHTWPDDIDIMLVSPGGQNATIWSDAGAGIDIVNATVTLSDAAAAPLPDDGPITSGTYRPTNYEGTDSFPTPAPPRQPNVALSTFLGGDPNGTWNLYVVDDSGVDAGAIAGGWCLQMASTGPTPTPTATNTATATATNTPTSTPSPTPLPSQYCTTTPITIPREGPAGRYPAPLVVSGEGNSLTALTVTFNGVSHEWPDDMDIMLVSPGGQNATIWSDSGLGGSIVNATVTLNDAAAAPLPDDAWITSGTYRPTNYEGPDSFPAPAPPPQPNVALSTFLGGNPNGTWSLYIVDDWDGHKGAIAGGWCLQMASSGGPTSTPSPTPPPSQYCTTTPITIPWEGPAAPYPAPLVVSGEGNALTALTVTFNGVSHVTPSEIDIMLVSPGGQNATIWSDAGLGGYIVNATVTLSDAAAAPLPDHGWMTSGTYRPANYGGTDSFPAPAPPPQPNVALSTFLGSNPNGTWNLFIVDDGSGGGGAIAGGWCLRMASTPLAVTLARFEATIQGEDVRVEWETVSELDNLGFNLLRGAGPDAEPTRLNAALIPSRAGGSSSGASYEYLDLAVPEGTHFYWLDSVSTTGVVERAGPVVITMGEPTVVTVGPLGVQRTPAIFPLALAGTLGVASALLLRRRR